MGGVGWGKRCRDNQVRDLYTLYVSVTYSYTTQAKAERRGSVWTIPHQDASTHAHIPVTGPSRSIYALPNPIGPCGSRKCRRCAYHTRIELVCWVFLPGAKIHLFVRTTSMWPTTTSYALSFVRFRPSEPAHSTFVPIRRESNSCARFSSLDAKRIPLFAYLNVAVHHRIRPFPRILRYPISHHFRSESSLCA